MSAKSAVTGRTSSTADAALRSASRARSGSSAAADARPSAAPSCGDRCEHGSACRDGIVLDRQHRAADADDVALGERHRPGEALAVHPGPVEGAEVLDLEAAAGRADERMTA